MAFFDREDFEWDNGTADATQTDHRVTFDAARAMFTDPLAIDWPDERENRRARDPTSARPRANPF